MTVDPQYADQAADVVRGIYTFHRKLVPGDVVLDIGAHVGYFSLFASNRIGESGKVYSFEPHPENFANLVFRMDRAQIAPVSCLPFAAWSSDAIVEMYPMKGNSGGHSLFKFEGHETHIMVKTLNIGAWCQRNNINPTFVKIDAENAEYEIIKSLFEHGVRPYFAMEIHSIELRTKCYELFSNNNYEAMGESPESYIHWAWPKSK